MRVGKNYELGEEITDVRDLLKLAEEKKSVIIRIGFGYWIKPAAFMIHWSLAMIVRYKIYKSIKIES